MGNKIGQSEIVDTPDIDTLYADIDAALEECGVILEAFEEVVDISARDYGRQHDMKTETATKLLDLLVSRGVMTVQEKRRKNYTVKAYRMVKDDSKI
jgi:hypothetical protein